VRLMSESSAASPAPLPDAEASRQSSTGSPSAPTRCPRPSAPARCPQPRSAPTAWGQRGSRSARRSRQPISGAMNAMKPCYVICSGGRGGMRRRRREDHVWFEDRWMVASLCDE
jgi:hypothetical protein